MPPSRIARLFAFAALAAAVPSLARAEWIHHRGDMPGTDLRVTLWTGERAAGEAAMDASSPTRRAASATTTSPTRARRRTQT